MNDRTRELRMLRKIPVTAGLILCNMIIFLLVDFTGGTENTAHMLRCGAAYPPAIVGQGEWYRIFTCMFLHFGIEHLLNNMLTLAVLGERLEVLMGHVSFLLVYLLGGIGGNLVSLWMSQRSGKDVVSAGASGCVFALLGGILYLVVRNKGRAADLTMRRVLIMAGLSLYLGLVSRGVDNAAHIGGLICGFLAAVVLYHPQKK